MEIREEIRERLIIDLNVNFTGLAALLNHVEGKIMSAITDALKTSNDAMLAHVTTLEAAVATLIVTANETKAALTDALANGTLSPADATAIQAVIDNQTTALANVDAASTSATAAAVADAVNTSVGTGTGTATSTSTSTSTDTTTGTATTTSTATTTATGT